MAAEGLITLDELRAKLSGLDETRRAAETEIGVLRGRRERVEELERHRDTLLDSYANLIPEALQELGPGERRQIYAMLRLRIAVDLDGNMKVTGLIGAGEVLCESGRTSLCAFKNTKTLGLTLRAVLGGGSLAGP
jgi:hypothetical protein